MTGASPTPGSDLKTVSKRGTTKTMISSRIESVTVKTTAG
jgi:hypothetical protein